MFHLLRWMAARLRAAWEADEYPASADPRRRPAGEVRARLQRRSRLARRGCCLPPLGDAAAWDAALVASTPSGRPPAPDGALRLRRIARGPQRSDTLAA